MNDGALGSNLFSNSRRALTKKAIPIYGWPSHPGIAGTRFGVWYPLSWRPSVDDYHSAEDRLYGIPVLVSIVSRRDDGKVEDSWIARGFWKLMDDEAGEKYPELQITVTDKAWTQNELYLQATGWMPMPLLPKKRYAKALSISDNKENAV